MQKDVNYKEVVCDICKRSEKFKNKISEAGYLSLNLPYENDRKIRDGSIDVCKDCAEEILKTLETRYVVYYADWEGLCIEKKEDKNAEN